MKHTEYLGDEIAKHGVSAVFGIPGSGATLSLIDNLESKGIPFYLTQFEGSGALMAATMGRLTGKAGVSLSIKGPGLTNAIPGIAAAWFESFPVVHLAEAAPRNAPLSQAHKRIDQRLLCKTFTKRSGGLEPGSFTDLANLAQSEEPGPVVLELTEEILGDKEDISQPESIARSLRRSTVELIKRSNKPIVIAGTLALRQGFRDALSALSIPVFSTVSAKGIIDETLDHAAGIYTGVGLSLTPESTLISESDLIICIGLTAKEVLSAKPFKLPAINIEAVDTSGIEGFDFYDRIDVSQFTEVVDCIIAKSWGLKALALKQKELFEQLNSHFLPGIVFTTIQNHFDIFRSVLDTGYFCTIGEHALKTSAPELCLMSGQGRYMGTCIPMALAAAICDSTLPTLAFVGDGGIGMYLAEVRLAVKLRLPVLLILMSDNSFGSIRTRAIKDKLTQKPLMMDGSSWVPVLNGFGIPSTRVENLAELDRALKSWDIQTGPAFLEINFKTDLYQLMVTNIR